MVISNHLLLLLLLLSSFTIDWVRCECVCVYRDMCIYGFQFLLATIAMHLIPFILFVRCDNKIKATRGQIFRNVARFDVVGSLSLSHSSISAPDLCNDVRYVLKYIISLQTYYSIHVYLRPATKHFTFLNEIYYTYTYK